MESMVSSLTTTEVEAADVDSSVAWTCDDEDVVVTMLIAGAAGAVADVAGGGEKNCDVGSATISSSAV